MLIAAARRADVSVYIDDGATRWLAIHRNDAATLFRLAIEKAPAGSALHGAGESAITLQTIAHHIGRIPGIPTVSLTLDGNCGKTGAKAVLRRPRAELRAS